MSAYVIPPVNAEAMATTGARFGIADWQLLYSSVPETPPAAYNAATSYAANAEIASGAAGGVVTVWRSKQAANLGKPLVAGDWWEYRGDTYALWNAATNYAAGAMVLRVETHSIYKRVTAGTTAQAPELDTTGVNWVRVATSNRWAMFDMRSSQVTLAVSPLIVQLQPGRITALNMTGLNDGTVKFDMTSGGVNVWSPVASPLDSTPINDWADYFFAPFSVRSTILEQEIPSYSDGILQVRIDAGVGLEIGKLIVGDAIYIGETELGPRVRRRGFSVIERDNYGELQDVVPRKSIPLISDRMLIEKQYIQRARAALDFAASGVPCVFVGLDNDQDEYADLLTTVALCTDFEFELKEHAISYLTLETEGI
ncbi:hypothetical protein G7048_15705 [Diaphorobacter sp. HDW4B]|uniref:hypothetical protein n=1 Tax=Diaphorobacter sp. HDW4B TaxID=2714925 RepID=UPI00140A4FCC|nr:hypothetical protein [Diaphorobacter sp. HDW4B]QIL71673.1 hypothetical protein G7048_15705 [Diaphorobacter sp. HDW4B]